MRRPRVHDLQLQRLPGLPGRGEPAVLAGPPSGHPEGLADPRGEPGVLRMVGLAFCRPAAADGRRGFRMRPEDRGRDPARASPAMAVAEPAVQSGFAGILQIRGLLRRFGLGRPGSPRAFGPAARAPGRPARGHLVLHVPGPVLHGGRLSRTRRSRARSHPVLRLPDLFSAAGGGPHRAGVVPAAPVPAATGNHPAADGPGPVAHRVGILPEGGDRGLVGALGGSGIPARRGRRECHRVGHSGLRRADLRRLRRVFGHRPGRGQHPGLRALGQLRPALSRGEHPGILAALAPEPVELVPGLCVPAARG